MDSTFHSAYCDSKEDEDIIDLGLSLRTLQPQVLYHPSEQLIRLGGFHDMSNRPKPELYMKNSNGFNLSSVGQDCVKETEGVESKKISWGFIKVNMDGFIVGRKICILDHACYLSLTLQLEDMFDRQLQSGLRLFQTESEFLLLYKDKYDNWRAVGDVLWKEFTELVKRLRIAQKNESLLSCSPRLEMYP